MSGQKTSNQMFVKIEWGCSNPACTHSQFLFGFVALQVVVTMLRKYCKTCLDFSKLGLDIQIQVEIKWFMLCYL